MGKEPSNLLSIGQVSSQVGIPVETVRFYERQGLLKEPMRKASGYRQYGQEVIPRLEFIKRAKDLGFSLEEIADFLALRTDSSTSCEQVRRSAQEKLDEVDRKLEALTEMRRALEDVIAACDERIDNECPFLAALARQKPGFPGNGSDPRSGS